MKLKTILVLILFLNIFSSGKAQVNSFNVEVVSGPDVCRTYLKFKLYCGPISEPDALIKVYLDGNTTNNYSLKTKKTTINATDSTELIVDFPIYNDLLIHTVALQIFSKVNQQQVDQTVNIQLTPNYLAVGKNCGSFNTNITDENNLLSPPLDYISPDNQDTLTLTRNADGHYVGMDIYNPGKVCINPTWLQIHNNISTPCDIPYFHHDSLTMLNLWAELYPEFEVTCVLRCAKMKITTKNIDTDEVYSKVIYDYLDIVNNQLNTFQYTGNYYSIGINSPISLSVNNQWLEDHNLFQVTPDITEEFITDFAEHIIYVSCNPVSTNSNDYSFSYAIPDFFVAPLETGSINVKVCNNKCLISSDTNHIKLKINYSSFLTPSLTNLNVEFPQINTDTLIFEKTFTSSCETFEIPFTFPGSTPPGTIVHISSSIFDLTGEETEILNNQNSILTEVVNSYDPNNKISLLPHFIDANTQEKNQYKINFQNEGNYLAIKVVIEDTLSELLDLSTFRLLETKHPVSYSINTNARVITFTFMDIFLHPKTINEEESKGYIIYEIKELENLPVGSTIENTAYIYFDFNSPIQTNTTSNINSELLNLDEITQDIIRIYPNPANHKVYIEAKNLKSVQFFDLSGKTILLISENANEVDVTTLKKGIYFVRIESGNSTQVKKLIIN